MNEMYLVFSGLINDRDGAFTALAAIGLFDSFEKAKEIVDKLENVGNHLFAPLIDGDWYRIEYMIHKMRPGTVYDGSYGLNNPPIWDSMDGDRYANS